jgi:hypothetical protein
MSITSPAQSFQNTAAMKPDSLPLQAIATSLRPLFSFGWRTLLTLTACRAIFVVWQWDRIVDADMLATVLAQGFRSDTVLLGLLLTVPAICFPFLASNSRLVPAWRALLTVCLPVALLLIVLMECGTPSFVDQLDTRPNLLFLEYLNHPRKVGASLWATYQLPILCAIGVTSALTWVNTRQIGKLVRRAVPTRALPAMLVAPLLVLMCVVLIRSTLDYRPADPLAVAHSVEPAVTKLALNGAATVTDTGRSHQ